MGRKNVDAMVSNNLFVKYSLLTAV